MSPSALNRRSVVAAGFAASLTPALEARSGMSGLPEVEIGRIERLPQLASAQVAPRHVDVWLPPGHAADRSHAVLYLHDGQMLFDPRITWNRQAWHVHRAVASLMSQSRIPPTLVVGIWNHGPERYAEYFPERALAFAGEDTRRAYVRDECNGRPKADAYLRFIVDELKPHVDARFAPRPGREHTFVMGSSMGGLASLYALCEQPAVFGGAAALSAHWVGLATRRGLEAVRNAELPLALLHYLQRQLPEPEGRRLWVDRGDDALDSLYAPALAMFSDVLRDRGWSAQRAVTRVWPGTGHDETDWGRRLEDVLAHLMAR